MTILIREKFMSKTARFSTAAFLAAAMGVMGTATGAAAADNQAASGQRSFADACTDTATVSGLGKCLNIMNIVAKEFQAEFVADGTMAGLDQDPARAGKVMDAMTQATNSDECHKAADSALVIAFLPLSLMDKKPTDAVPAKDRAALAAALDANAVCTDKIADAVEGTGENFARSLASARHLSGELRTVATRLAP
jgi:hypothetical protein